MAGESLPHVWPSVINEHVINIMARIVDGISGTGGGGCHCHMKNGNQNGKASDGR